MILHTGGLLFGEISTRSMPASTAILTATIVSTVPVVEAVLIDQLDLRVADFIVDARSVLSDGGLALCWDGEWVKLQCC